MAGAFQLGVEVDDVLLTGEREAAQLWNQASLGSPGEVLGEAAGCFPVAVAGTVIQGD